MNAKTAAAEIVGQMNTEDRASFTREGWRDGVSAMLQGEWEGLDLDEVLGEVEQMAPINFYGVDGMEVEGGKWFARAKGETPEYEIAADIPLDGAALDALVRVATEDDVRFEVVRVITSVGTDPDDFGDSRLAAVVTPDGWRWA